MRAAMESCCSFSCKKIDTESAELSSHDSDQTVKSDGSHGMTVISPSGVKMKLGWNDHQPRVRSCNIDVTAAWEQQVLFRVCSAAESISTLQNANVIKVLDLFFKQGNNHGDVSGHVCPWVRFLFWDSIWFYFFNSTAITQWYLQQKCYFNFVPTV